MTRKTHRGFEEIEDDRLSRVSGGSWYSEANRRAGAEYRSHKVPGGRETWSQLGYYHYDANGKLAAWTPGVSGALLGMPSERYDGSYPKGPAVPGHPSSNGQSVGTDGA
jgi:hypothetical protein